MAPTGVCAAKLLEDGRTALLVRLGGGYRVIVGHLTQLAFQLVDPQHNGYSWTPGEGRATLVFRYATSCGVHEQDYYGHEALEAARLLMGPGVT